jgi:hypothetical protein
MNYQSFIFFFKTVESIYTKTELRTQKTDYDTFLDALESVIHQIYRQPEDVPYF